jgi:hypothetical protein
MDKLFSLDEIFQPQPGQLTAEAKATLEAQKADMRQYLQDHMAESSAG